MDSCTFPFPISGCVNEQKVNTEDLMFSVFAIPELVSTDPFIVKLQFEPSGRPESKRDYYLTVKENLCVVCGKRESYIR